MLPRENFENLHAIIYILVQWFLNWVRPNPRGSVRL